MNRISLMCVYFGLFFLGLLPGLIVSGDKYDNRTEVAIIDYVESEIEPLYTDLKACFGCYGGGSDATGGRGQTVVHVTNLNNSGTGSLRDAVGSGQSNRTIVFDVSGTIELTSNMTVTGDNLTFFGQTAPVGGITVTGGRITFDNADNIIILYMRFRPDFVSETDGVTFWNCSNVMVDHCSVSWGGDEDISTVATASHSFTMSNTIVGEGKTGQIMGDSNDESQSWDLSNHANLYYNVSHRHPNPNSNGAIEVINNVVWNYGQRSKRGNGGGPINDINNYTKGGNYGNNAMPVSEMNKWIYQAANGKPEIYSKGNLYIPTTVTDPNAANTNQTWTAFTSWTYNSVSYSEGDALPSDFFVSTQHPLIKNPWPIMTALEALEYVKDSVGANKSLNADGTFEIGWDSVDDYYLDKVRNNTVVSFVQYASPVGKAWYDSFHASVSSTPINTRPAGYYVNNAHIPETWFAANVPPGEDHNDLNADGYTWLEVFANQVYSGEATTPTCSDGIQNGDETGVDCGGSCDPCPSYSAEQSKLTKKRLTKIGL
jgi:hypothetical protein